MTDTATTTDTTAPAGAASTTTSWLDGKPAEFIGTLENRGVKDKTPDEVAVHFYEAHRNATQALSKFGSTDPKNILVRPKDEADTAGWDTLYGQLRPAKADDYGITGENAKPFMDSAHELGLTKNQAAKLWAKQEEGKAASAKEAGEQAELAKEAFRKEQVQHQMNWRGKEDDNMQMAVKGLKAQYGLSDEEIATITKSPGFSKMLEGGLKYAQATGEDKFTSGDAPLGGARSYEQAKAALADFKQNPNGPDARAYTNKADPRHAAVKKEMARVYKIVGDYEARQKSEYEFAA